LVEVKVGGIGYPTYGAFFPSIVKRNYGKWISHEFIRPGVIEHVSKTGEKCTVLRVLGSPNGMYSTSTIRWFSDLVDKYADGFRVTARNSIELVGVKPDKVDELISVLKEEGWPVGGTGKSLHQIVCCTGFVYCQQPAIDSPSLMKAIADALFSDFLVEKYPAKLKISISGCPNNCGEGSTADIGIMGIFKDIPSVGTPEEMKRCEIPVVVSTCPTGAIRPKPPTVEIIPELCIHCGSCALQCAYISFGKPGAASAAIYVGGKAANSGDGPAYGKLVAIDLKPVPPHYEEIVDVVKRIKDSWVNNARKGERVREWIERIGWEKFYEKTSLKMDVRVIDNFIQNIVALKTNVRFRW
jgi:sulfite reductase beta subunit